MKKKVQTKDIRTKRLLPGAAALGLVSAVIIYAVMLHAEKSALSDFSKGGVVLAVTEIPKGQMITADNAGEYFVQEEIDEKLIPENAAVSVEQLLGTAALYAVDAGTVMTAGMTESVNEITEGMTEPVIAGFKAEDLYQAVGGVLRSGDRIHIYRVLEKEAETDSGNGVEYFDGKKEAADGRIKTEAGENKTAAGENGTSDEKNETSDGETKTEAGENETPAPETEPEAVADAEGITADACEGAELLWENIYVQEVFDQAGNRIISGDTETAAQRINVYLDKEDVAAFYAALDSGTLRIVKKCN